MSVIGITPWADARGPWGEAITLCAEGRQGSAGQWTITGTCSQTSTGTIRQMVLGSQTVLHSVIVRRTVTGTHWVVVQGTCRQTV
jgi:hypothetical protein